MKCVLIGTSLKLAASMLLTFLLNIGNLFTFG